MFAVLIVVSFLSGLAGHQGADVVDHPRAA